jgi:hypothetical protein
MHRHPHGDQSISGIFSRTALLIAADAVAVTERLEDVEIPPDMLRNDDGALQILNRYLNCISPGATALLAQRDHLPKDSIDFVAQDVDLWVDLKPAFFKRTVTEIIARLALRSLSIAGSTLGAHLHPSTKVGFKAWTGGMDFAAADAPREDKDTIAWVAKVLTSLPRRDTPLYADFGDLPDEAQSESIVRLLATRYDEGEATRTATANYS